MKTKLNNLSVIKYLMTALENNYLEDIAVIKVMPSKIVLALTVSQVERIRPTYMMIEANLYTNKQLLVKGVEYLENSLCIHTFNNIDYEIYIKSKK